MRKLPLIVILNLIISISIFYTLEKNSFYTYLLGALLGIFFWENISELNDKESSEMKE